MDYDVYNEADSETMEMIDLNTLGMPGHAQAIVDLANKFNKELVKIVDPRDYEKEPDVFINLIITCLSIPFAEMAFKLSQVYGHKDSKKMEQQFIDKFKLAMKWRIARRTSPKLD